MTGRPQDAKDDALPFSNVTRTRDGDLTVLTVRGEATPAMLIGAYRELLAEPTARVLWDMRNGWLARLAHDQLRWSMSQLVRSGDGKRPHGRSAFVCRTESDRNVMRLLIAYAEANGYRIELGAFSDIEKARHWLAGGSPGQ
jgi:hypothetical protein